MFQKLIENLFSQKMGYKLMLLALEAEVALPPNSSLEVVIATQQDKEKAVHHISELESKRLSMTAELLTELDLPNDTKLEVLADHAPLDEAALLIQFKTDLLEVVEKIQSLSRNISLSAQARANVFAEVQGNLQKYLKQPSLYSKYGRVNRSAGSLFYNGSV
ncbi:MAG: flagellar export chaperone FlgN [SAR324 cluster bacterium]|nr:flagellar export chaperone FlgN [SAR324 cluster bacterium]